MNANNRRGLAAFGISMVVGLIGLSATVYLDSGVPAFVMIAYLVLIFLWRWYG